MVIYLLKKILIIYMGIKSDSAYSILAFAHKQTNYIHLQMDRQKGIQWDSFTDRLKMAGAVDRQVTIISQ